MIQHYQDNLGEWHELDDVAYEYLLTQNQPNLTFTPKTQADYDAAHALTLAQAQSIQLSTLNTAYQNAIQQPVSYTSAGGILKTYQADLGSQDTLSKMINAYSKTGIVPTGFYWVAADNTQVPFTFSDMQQLASAMAAQGWAAFQHLQALKASVTSATTVAQAQAAVW